MHDFVEAFDRTMESKVMDALRDAMIVSLDAMPVYPVAIDAGGFPQKPKFSGHWNYLKS